MKNKKFICIVFMIIVAAILNWYIIRSEKYLDYPMVDLNVKAETEKSMELQIYYDTDNKDVWAESHSIKGVVKRDVGTINYKINCKCERLRVDFGNEPNNIKIFNIFMQYKNNKVEIPLNYFTKNKYANQVSQMNISNGYLEIETNGEDSYCIIDISELDVKNIFLPLYLNIEHKKNIGFCVIVNIIFLLLIVFLDNILYFAYDLYNNRRLVLSLAKNDFKTRYAGSYLGIIWAFIQPVVTILVYWFVFQVGFRSGPVDGCPYILWFMAGLIPWFFFSEALSTATNSLIEYNYLVKKVVFKINILPVVKVLSALFVHMFFVGILLVLFVGNGYHHGYMIQVIYYSLCMIVLALGLSYFTSACVVFFKDLSQIISIILQVGMWLTPIMWNYTMVPVRYQWVLKLNPMFYVVEGYRNSLISRCFFLSNIREGILFWIITAIIYILGIRVFQKLKIHFADIL